MVDLIQSEPISQIGLIRIGIIWIGMAASGKSYAPPLGRTWTPSARTRPRDSRAGNSYGCGLSLADLSRFDREAEKSEAWAGLRAIPNSIDGNEGIQWPRNFRQ